MTATETTAYKVPEIPSKFDIIPIHNSDRAAFKRCRRYWDWSSPARHNLTLRADVLGINKPMWFGTGIHYALQHFYTPGLRRDPVETWKTWFDVQWRGGIVTAEWLPLVYDLKPQAIGKNPPTEIPENPFWWDDEGMPVELWKVRGLEDILPDPDHNEFDDFLELGIGMMTFYRDYAEKNDGFEVLVPEHDFSVPIWDYENKCILKAIDRRENSPNYGKLLEVHARGRQDGITIKPNDKLGIIDHKTAASVAENYFLKLETDEQCTSYLWAAEVEANYYDLPHRGEPFEEVLYNVLRKAYPLSEPVTLQSGMFSVDREKQSVTYEIMQNWIAKNLPGVTLTEKQLGFLSYLKESGDEQFIVRKSVRRNRHQIANAGYRLYLETLDMLSQDMRIYPNISDDWRCLNCAFRSPCLATEDGGDWEQLIADNYTSNKDR